MRGRRALFRARAVRSALLAAAVTCASRALAGDATDVRSLLDESVVTTASQTAETETTSPGTSTIITSDDLQRYGITTLAQALDFLSLGVVTSDPLHDVEVGSRGVLLTKDRGAHFLLLIDGHAQNEPLYGSMNVDRGLGLPIELIDHVEVVLGPGSVLYGSNAMLGVINVVTKRAKDYAGLHFIAQSEIARSYRFGIGGGAQTSLFGHPAELTFGAEHQWFDGGAVTFPLQHFGASLGSGNTPERFGVNWPTPGYWGGTATHQYYQVAPSGYARLRVGDFEAAIHGSIFKEAYPYWDSADRDTANFDDARNASVDRRASLDLKYHATLSPIVALSVRGYGDLFDRQRRGLDSRYGGCLYVGVNTCDTHEVGLARWTGVEAQTRFDWAHDETIVTLLGVDARLAYVGSKLDVFNLDTGQPLRSSTLLISDYDRTLGAYFEQVLKPARWFEVNVGARLDVGKEYSPVGSPRGAALFRPWTGGAFKVAYSEAFRAPTWYERDASRVGIIASNDLQPERVRSTEASIEQRFGGHRIRFGVYRSWWRNLITDHTLTDADIAALGDSSAISITANNYTQYRNVTTIDSYGYDALFEGTSLAGALRYGIDVSASYTRQSGDDGQSLRLPVAPQAFGNARLSYDLPGSLPTIAAVAQIIGPRLADNYYGSGFTPPPTVTTQLALRFNVTGPVPAIAGLTYTAGVSYIFGSAEPYVAGPIQKVSDTLQPNGTYAWHSADLVPIDRLRVLVGLRYDFGAADAAARGAR